MTNTELSISNATLAGAPLSQPATAHVVPTVFESGRFFVETPTAGEQSLRLLLDTGGGLFVQRSAVERVGLPTQQGRSDGGDPIEVLPLPPDERIPPLVVSTGGLAVLDEQPMALADGVLGQAWFRQRVWTFDYPRQEVIVHEQMPPCASDLLGLGFLETARGARLADYPRIQVEVDGSEHDLLFDTGATVSLTDGGYQALGGQGARERATSFIVRSVFERWRTEHPSWRVIEAADRLGNAPMIEVPEVRIGQHRVGPVWFTVRDDGNFHDWMSQYMDRRIDGALGGSALKSLRITVDYAGARACVSGSSTDQTRNADTQPPTG